MSATRIRIAHTADLHSDERLAIRAMIDQAFAGSFTDEDWDHALGGMHAMVWDGGDVIAHGSVVQRRLLHGGTALRTGYVEGVAVRADRRRQGHGAAVMIALERVIRTAYEFGALSATDDGAELYTARGWQRWCGVTSVLAPTGIERTADDDGSVYVLEVRIPVDLSGELTCDWRPGDVW